MVNREIVPGTSSHINKGSNNSLKLKATQHLPHTNKGSNKSLKLKATQH